MTVPRVAPGSTLPEIPPTPPAIEYRGVTFSYRAPGLDRASREHAPAVENVSLTVYEGERLGVLGPNGGGKSTLLKLTLGLLRGYSGEIRIFGNSPEHARRKRLVGYVPQRIEAELRFPLSVRQVVAMSVTAGLGPFTPLLSRHQAAIDAAMSAVGVDRLANRPIGELSGGQLQRVMIARALAHNPRILVLDEPLVGVDPAGQQQFATLLKDLHARFRLTMVIVSHDIRTIAASSDRVACLSRTLHSHVAPEGLTPAVLAEVFRHDVAAIFGDVHVDAHSAARCADPSHHHAKSAPPQGHNP